MEAILVTARLQNIVQALLTVKHWEKLCITMKQDLFSDIDDDTANGDLKQKRSYDNTGKLVYELTNTYAYSIPSTMPFSFD